MDDFDSCWKLRYECQDCGREFNTERAMMQHKDAKNHRPFECHVCYDTFWDEEDREEHEHDDHHYCADCDRHFQSFNNLRMHLNSSRHRGGTIACHECSKNFTTATGLAHHFEMNGCPNKTSSRETIHRYVLSKDPDGLISKQLECDDSTTYEATEDSWNGDGYECYFCDREFNSLHSLNQHLNSAAHQQALYHCPNRRCPDFKTLAAIINHLESETCGIARFNAVQRAVSKMITRGRLLVF
ncbi:Zinc finger and BTB domain-containing protein 17 [Beauveria bassiana]|nr:Zinc finger and BTB domain-containing protein 17 [Beauveria bassiana]